jgi:small subunit ribosomal protein S1
MIAEETEKEASINYDATFESIKEGSVVKGCVVRITQTNVVVDIGYKSEGIIPAEEFQNIQELKIGDEIDVYVLSRREKPREAMDGKKL